MSVAWFTRRPPANRPCRAGMLACRCASSGNVNWHELRIEPFERGSPRLSPDTALDRLRPHLRDLAFGGDALRKW